MKTIIKEIEKSLQVKIESDIQEKLAQKTKEYSRKKWVDTTNQQKWINDQIRFLESEINPDITMTIDLSPDQYYRRVLLQLSNGNIDFMINELKKDAGFFSLEDTVEAISRIKYYEFLQNELRLLYESEQDLKSLKRNYNLTHIQKIVLLNILAELGYFDILRIHSDGIKRAALISNLLQEDYDNTRTYLREVAYSKRKKYYSKKNLIILLEVAKLSDNQLLIDHIQAKLDLIQ